MYSVCFSGVGKFKNKEYHIKFGGNAKPLVHQVRKIALALRGKLEKELQNMVEQGITSPVCDGESDWVNSLAIREKPSGRLLHRVTGMFYLPRNQKP